MYLFFPTPFGLNDLKIEYHNILIIVSPRIKNFTYIFDIFMIFITSINCKNVLGKLKILASLITVCFAAILKYQKGTFLRLFFLRAGITVDRKATNLSMSIWNQNPSVFSQ